MLLSGRNSIEDLKNVDVPYHAVPDDNVCRVGFVKKLIESKFGSLIVPGMLEDIMSYLCTE